MALTSRKTIVRNAYVTAVNAVGYRADALFRAWLLFPLDFLTHKPAYLLLFYGGKGV